MVRKERKPEIIDMIRDKLERSGIVIATDYRGLTVADMTDLRNKFRQQGIEYHVVKNTLTAFAAEAAGKRDLIQFLEGPTALVFGYDDAVQPAKIIQEFLKSADTPLSIKGGLLGDKALTSDDISDLAKLPPKEELIAKFVGLCQSPIARLVTVLNANIQGLVTVLQARVNQMEEGGV